MVSNYTNADTTTQPLADPNVTFEKEPMSGKEGKDTQTSNGFANVIKGLVASRVKANEMQRENVTQNLDSKYLFEKGTPKEFLKNVAFSI
jgi:hypothetical protein